MRAQPIAFTIADHKNAAAFAAAFLFGCMLNVASAPALAQTPIADKLVATSAANSAATSAAPKLSTQPPLGAAKSAPTPPTYPSAASATSAAPAAFVAPATPRKSFVTIGDKPAILFDAPSTRANKTFIVSPYTPLEMLVKLDKLTKVRDAEGVVGWVENATLGERRHVQISAASADVRTAASASASLVFEAQRTVLLEVLGSQQDGWLPVKHRDGQTGFVRLTQIWGD